MTRLTGTNSLSYTGVQPASATNFVTNTFDPTVNNYQNFYLGDEWLNTETEVVWKLVSVANNNAVWVPLVTSISFPITVPEGGTGQTSLAAHGVLIGEGTAPINSIVSSTSGQVLVSNGPSADPSWETVDFSLEFDTNTGGPVTPLAGTVSILGDGVNVTTDGSVPHTITISLTNALDHGVQVGASTGKLNSLAVGTNGEVLIGSTGADPEFNSLTSPNGSITFTKGSGTLALEATPLAASCSFFAYVLNDVPGFSGALVTQIIPFGSVLFNNGGNYDTSTFMFTAPNTGLYSFTTAVSFYSISSGSTEYSLILIIDSVSGPGYLYSNGNPNNMLAITPGNQSFGTSQTLFIPMNAGDTAAAYLLIGPGGASSVTLSGQAGALGSQYRTVFSGYQVA